MNHKERILIGKALLKFDNVALPFDIQSRISSKLNDYKEYLIYRELENIIASNGIDTDISDTVDLPVEEESLSISLSNDVLDELFKTCIRNNKGMFDTALNVDIPFVKYLVKINSPFILHKEELTKEKYPMTYKQYVDIRRFLGARKNTKEIFSDLYDEYCRFRAEIAIPYLSTVGSSLNNNVGNVTEFRRFIKAMQSNSLRPYTSKYFFYINTGDYPTSIILPNMVKNGITRGNDLDRDRRA